jgi:hypothetical protein
MNPQRSCVRRRYVQSPSPLVSSPSRGSFRLIALQSARLGDGAIVIRGEIILGYGMGFCKGGVADIKIYHPNLDLSGNICLYVCFLFQCDGRS